MNLNVYSEFEGRYEPGQELKWMADYLVQSLVLVMGDCQISEPTLVADLLNVLWKTLDFTNVSEKIEGGGAAVHSRFKFLKSQL